MKLRYKLVGSAALIAVVQAAAGPCAMAQQAPVSLAPTTTTTTTETKQSTEEIVVTGSRVKRTNLESESPIVTIGAAQIQAQGLTNTADVLNQLPQTGSAAITNTSSNFADDVAGINTVNLRNLGESRTLVLIDGRRTVGAVPVGAGANAVDFSSIPAFLIDKIDVVTGGGSATYGSEAVAGVVNVKLRDYYDGIMINQQYGDSAHNDSRTTTTDLLTGTSFGNGKGSLIFAAEYQDQGVVYSKNRAISAVDYSGGVYTPSSYSEFGRFATGSGAYVVLPDGQSVAPYNKNLYGYDRELARYIQVPTTNLNTYTKVHYDFIDEINYFGSLKFQRSTAFQQQEPIAIGNQATPIGFDGQYLQLPANNAYIPAALAALGVDNGTGNIDFRKRFFELGDRGGTQTRYSFSITNGFKGKLFNRFDWETYYTFGETIADDVRPNGGNVVNLQNALNTAVINGQIVCADPAARAAGCAPLDIFGPGKASAAALNYIRFTATNHDTIEESDFNADISGPILHLPYGDVQLALGAEHRREDGASNPDPISSSGDALDTSGEASHGGYGVTDLYAEGKLPILKDLPFAKSLTADASYRHSEYSLSSVGKQQSYNFAVTYAPFKDILFRVDDAVAIRAPTLNDLYLGKTQSATSVVDPCSFAGLAAAGASLATRTAYCVKQGLPAGGFTEDPGRQQAETSYVLGNPYLNAERARVITYGVVLTPRWVPGFSASIDGYKYNISGAVQANSTQSTVDECADTSAAVFCNLVHRDANGIITGVDQAGVNAGAEREQGIDVALAYTIPVRSISKYVFSTIGDGAAVDLTWNYTYVQYLNVITPVAGVVNYYEGLFGVPKNRWSLNALYRDEKVQFNYNLRYEGSQRFSNDGIGPSYGPVTYSDISARYQFLEHFAFYVGINNLLNQQPKVLDELYDQQGDGIEASGATGTATVPQSYDPIGRYYYCGIKAAF